MDANADADFEACTNTRHEYDDMVRMAVRNDVRVYPIDPNGFQVHFSDITGNLPAETVPGSGGMMARISRPGVMGSRILANDTGGISIAGTNNFAGNFARIVRDNSQYYVVSYYASAPRDGAFHRVAVRVKDGRGLDVRARSGYIASTPAVKGKAVKPPKSLSANARGILTGLSMATDLPIEIFTSVFQAEGYEGSVLIGVHMPGAALHLTPGDRIELSYAAIDGWGTMRAVERRAFALTMDDATRARVAQTGLRLFGRIHLPRGSYQIRVVASQRQGTSGAATSDIEVPNYTDLPLSISDVVVSSARAPSLLTLEEDPVLRQALPAQPSASRRFDRRDTVKTFVEIYDTHWILAREIGVTATLRADDGDIIMRSEQTLKSSNRGRFYFTGQLPLQELTPGKYVLNLEAYTRDGVPASASQELRFEVE